MAVAEAHECPPGSRGDVEGAAAATALVSARLERRHRLPRLMSRGAGDVEIARECRDEFRVEVAVAER